MREMWISPGGAAGAPSTGSGRLVRCATKNTLTRVTAELSSSGTSPPTRSRNTDSSRVSSWNSPSLSPSMSP